MIQRQSFIERMNYLYRERAARLEAEKSGAEQMRRCLSCASGCAMPFGGFLCVIYPKGFDRPQTPCPDWKKRN